VGDPYKILQVDSEAEFEVIEAAYRRLARKYHPDVSDTPETRERMVAINGAWEELRTPERRAKADRARARAGVAPAPAPAPGPAAQAPRQPTSARPPRPSPFGVPAGAPAPAPGDGSLRAAAQPRPGESLLYNQRGVPVGHDRAGGRITTAETWAGPPPGNASGSVVAFGRFRGWSIGEIARHDVGYLEWLERSPSGRSFRPEIDALLRSQGRRGQV
jgi:curved DNA-binding protein CbpA